MEENITAFKHDLFVIGSNVIAGYFLKTFHFGARLSLLLQLHDETYPMQFLSEVMQSVAWWKKAIMASEAYHICSLTAAFG